MDINVSSFTGQLKYMNIHPPIGKISHVSQIRKIGLWKILYMEGRVNGGKPT